MKKLIASIGLAGVLAAILLTTYSQPAKAQNGRKGEVCRAMVMRYKELYTQGQNPNTRIGIVVDFVSASPGCPVIPAGADLATAIAVIEDSGLELQPRIISGELLFLSRK